LPFIFFPIPHFSSVAILRRRFDLSLLLAVEAVRIDETLEARINLLAALLARPKLETFLHTNGDDGSAVAFTLCTTGGNQSSSL
jgi:hypothetical protein